MSPRRHHFSRRIAAHLFAACTTMMLLGCGDTVGPDDPAQSTRACQQTYEFGNTGCVEITGQVVGLRGQPLAGISVGPRNPTERVGFTTVFVTTDSAGTFSLRVSRMVGTAPAVGPDTASLWMVGSDPASAGVNIRGVQDSVLVHATVSPVGTIPTPATVRLTLPTP